MPLRYHVETFGCQMNFHDSERMAGLLDQAGFEPAATPADADIIIVNTCSVREHAVDKLFSRLGHLKTAAAGQAGRPLIVVAGCVAQQEGAAIFARAPQVNVVAGTQALRRLPLLIERALGSSRQDVDLDPSEDVTFPPHLARRTEPVKAYVTILEGCNDFCSYCVVPFTRGRERMRPRADILAEVREAAATGHKEVQLLGQIVNHYQAPDDPTCDFPALLEAVDRVPGIERIRFASPHPRHVSPRLIDAIRDLPHVCKHLHLPVQSGSTRILGLMRRRHTREEFLDLVARLRDTIPGISLSTDMIVGFPGESDADFEATLSLVREVRFSSIYSFKYSPRPNTLAARQMKDDVPEGEKGRRLVRLQDVQKAIQWDLHRAAVGQRLAVLADSRSRRRPAELAGRTTGNVVVNFPGRPEWLGRILDVTVLRAGANSLWGEVAGDPAIDTGAPNAYVVGNAG